MMATVDSRPSAARMAWLTSRMSCVESVCCTAYLRQPSLTTSTGHHTQRPRYADSTGLTIQRLNSSKGDVASHVTVRGRCHHSSVAGTLYVYLHRHMRAWQHHPPTR